MEAFAVEVIIQSIDHVLHDAETMMHDGGANLHAGRAQGDKLRGIAPSPMPPMPEIGRRTSGWPRTLHHVQSDGLDRPPRRIDPEGNVPPRRRIRAFVYDVRREARGPQISLSRTHPQFTSKLFAQEVPEIYDGIVEVKSVARDPGPRAKIAVMSNDSSIDPVGACVGMRGSRVQAVVNELQGEKIDIIPWSPDAATFIVNALQPAEVMKVVLDEELHSDRGRRAR